MNATLETQLLVFAVGAGWTVIFYFLKRTLASIDRKLEENRQQAISAADQLRQWDAARAEKINRQIRAMAVSATRQLGLIRHGLEKQAGQRHAEMERAQTARCGGCQRQYVSRQEFGAFTATINHKIDSIYEFLKKDERTPNT